MTITAQTRAAVEKALIEQPAGVLDYIAKEVGVSPADLISCLPADQVSSIAGDKFAEVMTEISGWGEITFLVHTADVILEAKGVVPEGAQAQGMYNLHGKPIGGHLRMENCASIAFVSRPLFKSDTHSVQFFNRDGGCMFKIYLGRDADRQLIPEQITAFKTYRDKLSHHNQKEVPECI